MQASQSFILPPASQERCVAGPASTSSRYYTPRRIRLIKQLKVARIKVSKLKKQLNTLKFGKPLTKSKMSIDEIVSAAQAYLPTSQLFLFESQLRLHLRKKNGYRWSIKLKLFALQLFFNSPQAYRCLVSTLRLPCRRTLTLFLSSLVGKMTSGFN